MSESEAEKDPSQIIYSMDESQKLSLEKDINNSLVQLEKLFLAIFPVLFIDLYVRFVKSLFSYYFFPPLLI